MSGEAETPQGSLLPSILQAELGKLVDQYAGILTLAEVIGVLEIVKIGLYHRGDSEEDPT